MDGRRYGKLIVIQCVLCYSCVNKRLIKGLTTELNERRRYGLLKFAVNATYSNVQRRKVVANHVTDTAIVFALRC